MRFRFFRPRFSMYILPNFSLNSYPIQKKIGQLWLLINPSKLKFFKNTKFIKISYYYVNKFQLYFVMVFLGTIPISALRYIYHNVAGIIPLYMLINNFYIFSRVFFQHNIIIIFIYINF